MTRDDVVILVTEKAMRSDMTDDEIAAFQKFFGDAAIGAAVSDAADTMSAGLNLIPGSVPALLRQWADNWEQTTEDKKAEIAFIRALAAALEAEAK